MSEYTNNPETDMDELPEDQLDQVAGGNQEPLPPVPGGKDPDPGGTPFGGTMPWNPGGDDSANPPGKGSGGTLPYTHGPSTT